MGPAQNLAANVEHCEGLFLCMGADLGGEAMDGAVLLLGGVAGGSMLQLRRGAAKIH